jgi:hypothetical protein
MISISFSGRAYRNDKNTFLGGENFEKSRSRVRFRQIVLRGVGTYESLSITVSLNTKIRINRRIVNSYFSKQPCRIRSPFFRGTSFGQCFAFNLGNGHIDRGPSFCLVISIMNPPCFKALSYDKRFRNIPSAADTNTQEQLQKNDRGDYAAEQIP